jgi:superfamily I DNA/RNA helicase
VLCVAPAGSGKTTTLVARIAWLLDSGAAARGAIAAITFNRRAAVELAERLAAVLEPLAVGADRDAVRVRTFHALGLEILRDCGLPVEPLVERMAVLRRIAPDLGPPGWRRLDTAFSKLKLDLRLTAADISADPAPGPIARAFLAYEAEIASEGGLDFDDLVGRALRVLETDQRVLEHWRGRCADLLVDEAQDLDRAQLTMALLLAAPRNRIFLVGDDDQSIYGWRLADVRRVLALANDLPGLRRVDLEVNYRCPRTVVTRAVRLVEHNRERFAKRIRASPEAPGPVVLAADGSDDPVRVGRVFERWGLGGGRPQTASGDEPPERDALAGEIEGLPGEDDMTVTRAVLARTNRELLPAIAVALERSIAFRPPPVELLVQSPVVDDCLAAAADIEGDVPLLARLERVRAELAARPHDDSVDPDLRRPEEIAAAVLAWAVPYRSLDELRDAIADRRRALDTLCREDAALSFATAHATKGLEFDHVAVIGMDRGRFPSGRSIADSPDPPRAVEEERRLAYVAWTRARRSLTLVYDPASPSPFLLEAFTPEELGLARAGGDA